MNKRHTCCKLCAFAKYDFIYSEDQEKGLWRQTDCELKILDKFRAANIAVIDSYDEEKEFFVVDDICLYGRSQKWLDKFGREKPVSEIYDFIRREISLKVEAIVYTDENTTIDDLEKTTLSLEKQMPRPLNLIFVQHPDGNIKPHEYRCWYFGRPKNNGNKVITWRLEMPIEFDASEGGYKLGVDRDRCIDIAVKKTAHQNILVVNAGFVLPNNYIRRIDEKINDDLLPLLVVKPIDGENGLFFRKAYYELIGGSRQKPFLEKVANTLEKESECQRFVMTGNRL